METASIETEGYEFVFEGFCKPENEGIGHYEFWGRPEYDETWVNRLQDCYCVEVIGPDGEPIDLTKMNPETIERVKNDFWDEIEEKIA